MTVIESNGESARVTEVTGCMGNLLSYGNILLMLVKLI